MKKLLLATTLTFSLFAQTNIDNDLDGVFDINDKCPNTPFSEIVNLKGCSKSQLNKTINIKNTLSFGYEYDKNNDYKDSNLMFVSINSTYNNKFYFNYFYSMLNENYGDGYKNSDSIFSFYYKYKVNSNYNIKSGIKYYLSTDYNDKADYAFKIKNSFYYKKYDFALSFKYKVYGESGTNPKNTITFETGYSIKKLYLSPYIYTENSKYNSNSWSSYYGLYSQYSLNKKLFSSLDISTDTDNSFISFIGSIGYKFQ